MFSKKPQLPPQPLKKKVLLMGDGGVGKTCLLIRFETGSFPNEYVPNTADNYTLEGFKFEDKNYLLDLWDTGGRYYPNRITRLSYYETDVSLLCFAVDRRYSFDSLTTRWLPELKALPPTTQVLLVGLRSDMRDKKIEGDGNEQLITKEEAQEMMKKLGLKGYFECSALTGSNVNEVFREGIRLVHQDSCCSESKSKKSKQTCILS
eukprot:TRINITY_DN14927_c0_g1_i1.p1 TRINITY_DN14927_c0_g1~~TRINITY_DN14927_c0_g1_i1.p1  ORF type:complete len:206 (-),score=39.12 TRINITY_DN14927_c0_g1_i1:131-748(-)